MSSPNQAKANEKTQSLRWPLSLKWRRGKNLPFGVRCAQTLRKDGHLYIGGGGARSYEHLCIVMKYDPINQEYVMLPKSNSYYFAMASVNNDLLLVGGFGDSTHVQLLDSESFDWTIHQYPQMPTSRSSPAAVGYWNYLIAACGGDKDTIEILDCGNEQWYGAQPMPVGGDFMTAVVISKTVYISSYQWRDGRRHVFSAHIPTLISSAISAASDAPTDPIWVELSPPPVHGPTLLALQNHLILVGGVEVGNKLYRYEPEKKRWSSCGELPVRMYGPSCAVLPSGELFVAGGGVEGVEEYSQQVWVGAFK